MTIKRTILVALLAMAVAGFAGVAVARYRHGTTPDQRIERASRTLVDARTALADEAAPSDRYRRYREGLELAEAELARALAEAPVRGEAAIALATLRWELDPPPPGADRQALIDLVLGGAANVPRRPSAQLRAGEALLRMGAVDAGFERVRTAVELDPARAGEGVAILLGGAIPPHDVVNGLPPTAAVLAALADVWPRPEDWLASVEGFRGPPSADLLRRYGTSCRALGDPARLVAFAERLGPQDDRAVEIERLIQLADAYLSLGRVDPAVESARTARSLDPRDVRAREFLGTVLLRGGDAFSAVDVFRDALNVAARGRRPAPERARLYRWLGQAHEARMRPDLAIDAYRLAIGLDSSEAVSRRRLDELDPAASR